MSKYTKEELALYKVAVGDAKEGTAEEIIQSCEEEAEFKRKVHEVIEPLVKEHAQYTVMTVINRVLTTIRANHSNYTNISADSIDHIVQQVKKVTKDTGFKALIFVMTLINAIMLFNNSTELQTVRKYMVNVAQTR